MSYRPVTLNGLLVQFANRVRDRCQRRVEKSRFLEYLNLDVVVQDLLREYGLEPDFDQQLLACVQAMAQPGTVGQTLVLKRVSSELSLHQIDTRSVLEGDLLRYEMVLFDGASHRGRSRWKHVFFPAQRAHWFVYDT